jgi:hypothetical protein
MESPEPATKPPATESTMPDASVLEDKTPHWLRMSSVSAGFVVLLGVVFVVLANRPLHHTDLWDHMNYGRTMLQHRTLFQAEPLLPLAKGVPMVNVPWLAQAGMSLLNERFGLSSLQFAYALLITASAGIIGWRSTKRSGSAVGGVLACMIFLTLNFQQFMVIRPQLLGNLFYCITVAWSFADRRFCRFTWIGMPLMFAVWANCHASFSTGLMLLALTGFGRFADVWIRSGSLRMAVTESQFDRTILLTQICAAAVLLNPYGLAVYGEVFSVAANPNIQSMFEWNPLNLRMNQGQWSAGLMTLLLIMLKLTPRRVRCVEVLPLLATGLMTMWSARMINWWAPLMAVVTATHLMAVIRMFTRRVRNPEPRKTTGLWTVVNVGLCWVLFACTTFGIQIVHGRTADPARLVSRQTPVLLANRLNQLETEKKIPRGIAYTPAEWSGYITHAGPAAIRPMVNLHVHLIPPEVWSDYLRIQHGPSDWEHLLEQYSTNLVAVDKSQQPGLLKRLAGSEDWTPLYLDSQAALFSRIKPL